MLFGYRGRLMAKNDDDGGTGSTGGAGGDGDTGTGDNNKPPELSNREVKAHPLFRELTQQFATMRKEFEALQSEKTEREAKKLEQEKNYEEALKTRTEKAVADARKAWDKERLISDSKKDAEIELARSGFKNKAHVRGLLFDFDPEKSTVEDFVKGVLEDKSHAPYLETSTGKPRPNPDVPTPHSKDSSRMTKEQIISARQSGKPEDVKKANEAAFRNWVETGSTGL